MRPVYISNMAVELPGSAVSNDKMEQLLGQAGHKPSRARRLVLRKNGIESRHYAIDPHTGKATHTNASLTAAAVRNLQSADVSLQNIGCLVCGTSTPDQMLPNHAVMVQGELEQPGCESVATAGVCLAGITALKYAWMAVATGEHDLAVATGSERCSALMRGSMFRPESNSQLEALEAKPEIAFEKEFLRWMLSDGAGAACLQPSPSEKHLSYRIEWITVHSFAGEQAACMYAGAVKNKDGSLTGWADIPPQAWLAEDVFAIKQDVKQLNENILHYTLEKPLADIIEKKGIRAENIDYFLPHYSSDFFREKLAKSLEKLGLPVPQQRWFTNLASRGNTGSASIYIMLEELLHSGRLKVGEKILCFVPESGRFSSAFMWLTVCDTDG